MNSEKRTERDGDFAAPRGGRPWRGAFVAAAALAACFAIAEAALWLAFPVTGATRRAYTQNLPGVQSEILYTSDRYGMRSISMRGAAKDPDVVRILCLGASTTNQPTQSTPDLWSAILNRMLDAEFAPQGVRVEVAALGIGGQRVFHRVAWCRENLDPFAPDIVVTLEGINDLYSNGGPDYRYSGPDDRLQPAARPSGSIASIKRALKSGSQIARRLSLLRQRLRVEGALRRGEAFEWHSRNLPEMKASLAAYPYRETVTRDPDPLVEFTDGVTLLLQELARRGIDTIVLAQPTLWKEEMTAEEMAALWFYVETSEGKVRASPAWLAREMARYNAAQAAAAQRSGAVYVPLDAMLPKTLDVFFDDCHFTDRGNVLLAEAIFPTVADRVRTRLASRAAR
jgi:hypothetical protein